MVQFAQLKSFIRKSVDITDEDFQKIIPYFRFKKIKKHNDISSIGELCNDLIFINTGSLISYSIDEQGKEHIIRFAFENEWIWVPVCFMKAVYSEFAIRTIEDTELLLLSYSVRESIFSVVPVMEKFFRKLADDYIGQLMIHFTSIISDPAETRYKKLIDESPELFNKVPLNIIASFLCVTPQSLSRIRQNMFKSLKLNAGKLKQLKAC